MPWVAERDGGGLIAPEEASDGVKYRCPSCGGVLTTRGSFTRNGSLVAKHFWHSSSSGGDCGGESDEHRRMKSIAMSMAKRRWESADVGLEVSVGDRRADVLVEFGEGRDRLGKGVAIEVQHKHEDKDTAAVSEDLLSTGYSVLWLHEDAYSAQSVDFGSGEWEYAWARQVPPEDYWPGYHGIIHWLRQEKPTSVEIEVPFPFGYSRKHLRPFPFGCSRKHLRLAWCEGWSARYTLRTSTMRKRLFEGTLRAEGGPRLVLNYTFDGKLELCLVKSDAVARSAFSDWSGGRVVGSIPSGWVGLHYRTVVWASLGRVGPLVFHLSPDGNTVLELKADRGENGWAQVDRSRTVQTLREVGKWLAAAADVGVINSYGSNERNTTT